MTLERHVTDTLKEWQVKLGDFQTGTRLYYPKNSLCEYLNQEEDIDDEMLCIKAERHLMDRADYLGDVTVTAEGDRFCFFIGREGCEYIAGNIPVPEFLCGFLKVLEHQDMAEIRGYFAYYADKFHTAYIEEKDDDGGTIFYLEDEEIEPYVYCVDENEFGITYHRFSRDDYEDLF